MKIYVDDMVKSCTSENHIDDLETSAALHKNHMKLNLAKCAFKIMSRCSSELWSHTEGSKLTQRKSKL